MIRAEDIAGDPGFVRLCTLHGCARDLRYVGSNNFAGRSLYGRWTAPGCATRLPPACRPPRSGCAPAAPGWVILVLDALRPQRVQEAIWKDVEGTPMQHYFAHPGRGSSTVSAWRWT